MNLILWRHAEAQPSLLPDLERELSAQGLANAARTAALLNAELPDDALILVSPARRAQQTASALQRPMQTLPELAPRSTVKALLQAINWPYLKQTIVLVGHQPTLGLTIGRLLEGYDNEIDVQNSYAYCLRPIIPEGQISARLACLIGPDFIEREAQTRLARI